jgi:hypothetical protein
VLYLLLATWAIQWLLIARILVACKSRTLSARLSTAASGLIVLAGSNTHLSRWPMSVEAGRLLNGRKLQLASPQTQYL